MQSGFKQWNTLSSRGGMDAKSQKGQVSRSSIPAAFTSSNCFRWSIFDRTDGFSTAWKAQQKCLQLWRWITLLLQRIFVMVYDQSPTKILGNDNSLRLKTHKIRLSLSTGTTRVSFTSSSFHLNMEADPSSKMWVFACGHGLYQKFQSWVTTW